ncbi:hypothetical protein N0V93_006378 [Gnomoniopsis smithogilvyi]|uniref:Rhodopsin domain-containing protein n=1 Tax=Gnomoniopsis smithogilvyi TaxID=1191159 RepID=A0A9W8YQN7_9PEZI|nr:hypothetical protein N0V93_006378 [Gnomoniopsis smithogilvyi]
MSSNGTSSDVHLGASYQGHVLACAIATWTIAALFVSLRFYLRGRLMHVLGREDWTILISLIFSCGVSASFIIEAYYGLGKHVEALTTTEIQKASEVFWVSNLLFAITIYLTKFSILFLYQRTLTHDWVQRTLRVLMVVVLVICLTDICLICTQCVPLNATWNQSVNATSCHSFNTFYIIVGIQIATDFLIYLLPLPVIWGMRAAPRNQKLMLFTLFSFGFFICIVSIIRLTELTATRRDIDWTYYSITIDFWTLVEANTGIVCACVMTMKPLLSRLILGANATRNKSDSNPDQLGPSIDLFHPPTIGSKPSRRNTPLNKKQSWFTAQLARLDRSLQTVNEAETEANSPSVVEAGGEGGGGLKPPRRRPSVAAFLTVPMRTHLSIPRLSHHSSIIESHMEHETDEGPLEPARYARRSSCAV